MQRIDRAVGLALAALALAVLWSARAFPAVPGQKLGAGFLPMLVGAGLLLAALALLWRARRAPAAAAPAAPAEAERYGAAGVVAASIAAYVALADRVGFLLLAPVLVLACCRAMGVSWRASVLWGLGATLLVHLAFYKLLRVPLPWGLLRPFY